MGHVETEVTLSSKENARSVKEKALIDTGATLTVLPRRVADELLVKADARTKVLTAAGPLEVELAEVLIEIAGRRATARVTISDIIERVLVGVTTLEILGLAVDPQTGSLREGQYLLYPT
ncbi:MAG: aspartyl protease family protein [Thaumarchaeota archaeon]|nr:aspartyl protease family protein [Nitrososphaerota archaeon]MCS4539723.1 aspartyl protease family protein [Nitrososphaerota archaeon]